MLSRVLAHGGNPLRFLFLMLFSCLVSAEEQLRSSLDLTGQQRMLSQQMLKAYCQMGEEIRYLVAADQLKKAAPEFEANHAALAGMGLPEPAKAALQRVQARWEPVKKITAAPVEQAQAAALYTATNELLAELDTLFAALQDKTREAQSELLVKALNQQMLTQRVAALYMVLNWGLEDPAYHEAYRDAKADFDENLRMLTTSPVNTAETRADLIKITRKWEMLEESDQADNKTLPNLMIRVLDRIEEQMRELVQLYLHGSELDTAAAAE